MNLDKPQVFYASQYLFFCDTRTDKNFVSLNKSLLLKLFSKKYSIEYASAVNPKFSEVLSYKELEKEVMANFFKVKNECTLKGTLM